MAYDEMILNYEMAGQDKILSDVARTVVEAYNSSFKPHIISKEKEVALPYYRWKHTDKGYSLLSSDAEGFENASVLTTDENIGEFVEHVFCVLAGNTSVRWGSVCESDAVNKSLAKLFETPGIVFLQVELFNRCWDESKSTSTIWVAVNMKMSNNVSEIMKSKGFTYFDVNLWSLQL